jgi:putative hydrolase of the HAD superfamily
VLGRWDEALGLERDTFLHRLYGGTDGTVLVGRVGADEHWAAICRALGLTPAQEREVRGELDASARLDTRLAAFLGGLRSRSRTAIVTNLWSDGRAELVRHGLDTLVHELVISAEVGVAKPDPAIFELALARLGAAPGEAVLVDDDEANVDAATAIGLHAIRHENSRATIAHVEALLAS